MRLRAFSAIAALILCRAFSQHSNSAPVFEVASVKPSAPGKGAQQTAISGGPGTNDPGQFSALNTPLWTLLLLAYQTSPYQVIAPDWLRSARFDVVAKVPRGASRKEFGLMLQNLLAERFKLSAHTDHMDLPPILRQMVKAHFSLNGELSHGVIA
jgi:uncharacterized protein (TIGR03435 family)